MHPLEWDCLSFSFFFSCVAFCPGGLQVLKRAQYPHIHILNLFWCQSPVPVDNTCSFGRLSLTQCLLFWPVHSHPSPHSQSVSETEKRPETRVLSNYTPLPNRKEHPVSRFPSMQTAGDIECEVRCQFSLDIFSKNTLEFFSFTLLFDPWSENSPQAW